jgi:hypothetical protein
LFADEAIETVNPLLAPGVPSTVACTEVGVALALRPEQYAPAAGLPTSTCWKVIATGYDPQTESKAAS